MRNLIHSTHDDSSNGDNDENNGAEGENWQPSLFERSESHACSLQIKKNDGVTNWIMNCGESDKTEVKKLKHDCVLLHISS